MAPLRHSYRFCVAFEDNDCERRPLQFDCRVKEPLRLSRAISQLSNDGIRDRCGRDCVPGHDGLTLIIDADSGEF
jgi:hypothetical protein